MARLRLFISAAPELEADREAVARLVAHLPLTIGWVIQGTPPRGQATLEALEFVERCDFHVFLLGSDIVAPMGAEWLAASRAKRTTLAFLRRGARTPAARAFAYQFPGEWNRYSDLTELSEMLGKALAQSLLERAQELHLTIAEYEGLTSYLNGLSQEERPSKEHRQGGWRMGGGDGVIISPDRDIPSGGVLIGQDQG